MCDRHRPSVGSWPENATELAPYFSAKLTRESQTQWEADAPLRAEAEARAKANKRAIMSFGCLLSVVCIVLLFTATEVGLTVGILGSVIGLLIFVFAWREQA